MINPDNYFRLPLPFTRRGAAGNSSAPGFSKQELERQRGKYPNRFNIKKKAWFSKLLTELIK